MWKYKFPYAVEAVAFFTCACSFTMDTLQYQFIYQTVSEDLNYSSNHSVEYCTPNQSQSEGDQKVADQVSKWTMYSAVSAYIPCMVGALLLTAWSDKIGRRTAIIFPVLGTTIAAALQLVIILFRLPLYCLIISEFIYGATGCYTGLMSIATAHLSDTVRPEDRGKRFTILEVAASFGGGMIQIATGHWIQIHGFIPPSFFIVGCGVVAVFFIPFMSSENSQNENSEQKPLLASAEGLENTYGSIGVNDDSCKSPKGEEGTKNHVRGEDSLLSQLKTVWRLYTKERDICDACMADITIENEICNHQVVRKRRVWRLWFFVLSFAIYMFGVNGEFVFRTMFFVSYPVCFTPDLVGAQNGLGNALVIGSPFMIILLQDKMKLSGQSIVIVGILTRIISYAMLGFATGPPLVFIATSLGVLYNFATAFLRLGTTSLVSPKEQGAALAVLSGVQSFLNIFSPITFLTLYPISLQIFHGFSYIVTALIVCIPFVLMLVVWIADKAGNFRRNQ